MGNNSGKLTISKRTPHSPAATHPPHHTTETTPHADTDMVNVTSYVGPEGEKPPGIPPVVESATVTEHGERNGSMSTHPIGEAFPISVEVEAEETHPTSVVTTETVPQSAVTDSKKSSKRNPLVSWLKKSKSSKTSKESATTEGVEVASPRVTVETVLAPEELIDIPVVAEETGTEVSETSPTQPVVPSVQDPVAQLHGTSADTEHDETAVILEPAQHPPTEVVATAH